MSGPSSDRGQRLAGHNLRSSSSIAFVLGVHFPLQPLAVHVAQVIMLAHSGVLLVHKPCFA